MRSPLLALLLATGCATPSLLPSRLPATDPYRVAPGDEWAPVVELYTPRQVDWSEARHALEVATVSSVVDVRVPQDGDLAVLRGPERAAEVAATYLCDRARFVGWTVALDAREVRLPADAWAFETLTPEEEGEAWTIVPATAARHLLLDGSGGEQLLSCSAPDAERVEGGFELQEAFCAGLLPVEGGGVVVKDPHVQTLRTGTTIRATAWLTDEGRAVVLDWSKETRRKTGQAEVLTGAGAVPVSLPRVVSERSRGRFVLRRDEALVFVRAATASEDVVLCVVGWAASRSP